MTDLTAIPAGDVREVVSIVDADDVLLSQGGTTARAPMTALTSYMGDSILAPAEAARNAALVAAAAAAASAAAADDAPAAAGFRDRADYATLLADTTLTYTSGLDGTVVSGEIIRTRKEGFVYVVSASGATNQHLTTAGGVKLRVQPGSRGYDVRAFGAVGDNTTDDAAAIQAAINACQTDRAGGVYFPAATYYCSTDLYFVYDATNNTGFPSGALAASNLVIEGAGRMDREDYKAETYKGSVIRLASGKKVIASSTSQRGTGRIVRNLSFIGSHSRIIEDGFAASWVRWEDIFVGTNAPGAGVAVFYVTNNYVSVFRNIEIVGADDFTTTAIGNLTGIGFHVDPSATAGGANIYSNITASYFETAIMLGNDYDAAKETITHNSKGSVCEILQGQYSNTGIHIKANFQFAKFSGCWSEGCRVAPVRIDNSAAHVVWADGNCSIENGELGDRGLIIIGNDTGTAGVDAAYNITVRNSRFFCTSGVAGIFVNDAARNVTVDGNSFHNGGGAAVGIQGGVGGEITLTNNNYFPETASSEISSARRVCSVGGTFASPTYTSLAHYALRADFELGNLNADLDCSTWRRTPERVSFNTSAAARTLTLPSLASSGGRRSDVTVLKPFSANTVTIDSGSGRTIKGAQTLVLSSQYTAVSLRHGGDGLSQWDLVSEVAAASTTVAEASGTIEPPTPAATTTSLGNLFAIHGLGVEPSFCSGSIIGDPTYYLEVISKDATTLTFRAFDRATDTALNAVDVTWQWAARA